MSKYVRSNVQFKKLDMGEKHLRELVEKIKGEPFVKVGVIGTKQYVKQPGGGGTIVPPTLVDIAIFHEFGTVAKVTDAMRGWFKRQGAALSPGTKEIRVPERSFMRSTTDEKRASMLRSIQYYFRRMVMQKITLEAALARIGLKFEAHVKDKFTNNDWAPLADFTLSRRLKGGKYVDGVLSQEGNVTPLVDSGQLLQSISFQVVIK